MTFSPPSVSGAEERILDVQRTTCSIVGGGPAGVILALLLARKNIPVMLLEAHRDFDREFRGDTVHPSTLEILDEIGLAEQVLKLRHTKIYGPMLRAANGPFMPVDLRDLNTKFPFIMLVPQTHFLEFLVAEAQKFPSFRLVMNGNVQKLTEKDGVVTGVRYLALDGWHEVQAELTVGADGRFSRVRHLAGIKPVATSPPMDVLWFRLPRLPEDPQESTGAFGGIARGHILVVLDRFDHWQVGYVFPKGDYQHLRAEGLEQLRRHIADVEPRFTKHVEYLTDWQQCSLLSVESSICPRWYRPGLLLIGDAAHVMSPVGGVGINYAIQDAVVAANLLAEPLRTGHVKTADLAAVQRKREWPVRFIQAFQAQIQKRFVVGVLRSSGPVSIPAYARFLLRLPPVRKVLARLFGFGIARVHVR
ncbi:MAG: monooxygenase FAD-binding protein [Bryobacterales bacterium]|nr:monooxygenase FAD-binding protein [Bryobacterales bacterium]